MKTRTNKSGFALVASISLAALVILITLAIMSFSTRTVRTAAISNATAEAQANARIALMLAIGELQKNSGLDTRITANADLLVPGAPPLTGVWRSWEGTNHDSTGRPIAPDYTVKSLDAANANSRFLGFLVSGATAETNPTSANLSDLVSTSATDDTIALLATGSLGTNPGQVHVEPQMLSDGTGSYAWWVSPENQKARVMQHYTPRTNDAAGLAEKWQSHSIPDLADFGLESLMDNPESFVYDESSPSSARRALTLATTKFIADTGTTPELSFHDLSTSAVGLLTNAATGGWKKDLSLLTEKWDDIYANYPGGELPLFRFSPAAGAVSSVPKPVRGSADYTPAGSALYPWSEYSAQSARDWPNTWHAGSASWNSMVNFATLYKNFTYSSGIAESDYVWAPVMKWRWRGSDRDATNQEFYDYNHTHRIHPLIARFQFIVYIQALPHPTNPGRYNTRLLYSPVITMWNPYNVRLRMDIPGAPTWGVVIGGRRCFPGAFTMQDVNWFTDPDDIPTSRYSMLSNGNFQFMDQNGNFGGRYDVNLRENIDLYSNNPDTASRANQLIDLRTWGANFPRGELDFEPGEVRMFTPTGLAERLFGGTAMGLTDGYDPVGPSGLPINRWGNQSPTRALWLGLRNEVFTQPFFHRSPGRGFNVSFGTNTGAGYTAKLNTLPGEIYSGVAQEMISLTALTDNDRANIYWPQEDIQIHRYSIGEIASVPAMPLYSITIGPRFTIGTGVAGPTSRPTKGFLQTDPLAGMSLVDPGVVGANSHPANGNFEMSYDTLTINSSKTPNLSTREGFIATGFQSGDGLSRLITHEIPNRPMASLLELQGWNPRGQNPMPPYQSHLIGNSDATPMIPSDNVVPSTLFPNPVTGAVTAATNLQHDDAYCANHLLFDDFFVSSIAPQPVDFGGNIARDIETVYGDFLKGDSPLVNRAYRPIYLDTGLSDTDVNLRVAEVVNSTDGDGWQKVASRLEVDGMFNVNSTSVEAWKALLSHAKSMGDIPYYADAGIDTVADNDDRPHPVTRTPIASDIEAGSDSAVGVVATSEFTGFRRLTDAQIDDLAEKIVEQVRLRGPFLSMSEFINRQLTTNEDLAIAGAVQSAINNLTDDPMAELRDSGNFLSDDTMHSKAEAGSADDTARLAGVGYEFEAAAEGSSAYGVPGWIRQADVLRPIAPILSARDDTFTIRAYGDARDADGNITARAWCEAVVQRQRSFVDNTDAPDATDSPINQSNQTFGRRYQMISFRWLQANEV